MPLFENNRPAYENLKGKPPKKSSEKKAYYEICFLFLIVKMTRNMAVSE